MDIFLTVLFIGLMIVFCIMLLIKYGSDYFDNEDDYDVSE